MAVDMAAFPSAPDHRFSQMTPKDVKRRTWRCKQEDAAALVRPEKARQDSAIDLCEEKRRSQVSKLSEEEHRCSEISPPDESQRASQVSEASADQRDSQISKLSNDGGQSQVSKVDTMSLFSIPPEDVPRTVDTTSLFTVHPDDLAFDFAQFDFPPGARLSRPFMMPTPIGRKRGSTMISRQSVISVELITDFIRSRRITQDSDTLSPTCLSPTELQRLYEDCIPQHPAFLERSAQPGVTRKTRSTITDSQEPPSEHSEPTLPLEQSKERVVSVPRQSSKLHLEHKCSILSIDRAGFAERVDDALQMLAETKERLYRAKKDLYIREEHCREIEVHATNMKKGMEEAMRNYSCTSKELASLKAFRWECSPSVPAQVLSMRQRKIHGELKMQIRDLERKLSTTMAELRCMEKKWREAQVSLTTCTRDLEKQKSIVDNKAEELRIAQEAKASSIEMLERAEKELVAMKEQLEIASREEAEAATRKQISHAELAEANKNAHRISQQLSQVEADCEESRVKIKQIKRASLAPDVILQKKLLVAKRELRDREELLGVVKQTNADLARKIAIMERELGGRKHLSAGEALS